MKRVLWIWFSVIAVLAVSYGAVELFSKDDTGSHSQISVPSHDSIPAVRTGGSIYRHSSSKADSIVAFASQLLGTKYQFGSCTPGGFDCSGFVYYVFSNFGVDLPRSSVTMGETGTNISLEEAEKGDLIFFTGTEENDPDIGHVGIVITNQGEPLEFMHSSSNEKEGGVKITPFTTSPKYQQRFVCIKRVF